MAKLFNIAAMTTATTGTGTVTLGSAVSSYLTFANAGVANGDVVTYVLVEGANREIGRGTYTASGTTLSRDTVLESTAAGAKISLAGAAQVFITAAAEDFALDHDLAPALGGNLSGNGFKINADATATTAGLNIEQTTLPSALVNGDLAITATDLYARINSQTGVIPHEQWMVLTADYTAQNVSSLQKIFNVGTGSAGAFNAKANVMYEVEIWFSWTNGNGSSATRWDFAFGGTATTTLVMWRSEGGKMASANFGNLGDQAVFVGTTLPTAAGQFTASGTQTSGGCRIKAIITTTGAGTIIPQIAQANSSAFIISKGAYAKFRAIGINTMNTQGDF